MKALQYTSEIVLDIQGLNIKSVTDGDGNVLTFDHSFENPHLGQALVISITDSNFIRYI